MTEEVDYDARTEMKHSTEVFSNTTYERNWNYLQKFYYRIEKRFPGSVDRIKYNITKNICSKYYW